jgi:hypothetical protein
MFERYTEKARRVVFFSRYEASQLGSPYIETEHILLGFFREEKSFTARWFSATQVDSMRREIEGHSAGTKPTPTSVDLPLTIESKRVLAYAAEEADRAGSRHIGPEHLLLGLLREKKGFAAELLHDHGLEVGKLREELSKLPPAIEASSTHAHRCGPRGYRPAFLETIEIHGQPRNADYIRRAVKALCEIPWHWQKRVWKPRDVAIHRATGTISFDVGNLEDSQDFDLLKRGWKKDYCNLCRWELFASKDAPDHATGYTNGRDWLCTECYDKFIARPDFFSSNYPDIT